MSYTALFQIVIEQDSLSFEGLQVFHVHKVFLELFAVELLEEGFFDEKPVFHASLPAEAFDLFGNGIVDLDGQGCFFFFHGVFIIGPEVNKVKKKLYKVNS